MKSTVIYARYRGDISQFMPSIREQIEACKEYACAHDMKVKQIYIDVESLDRPQRCARRKLLKDCRKHKWDHVLVTDMSRFARLPKDFKKCLSRLYRNKVHIISVNSDMSYKEQIRNECAMRVLFNIKGGNKQ